MLVYRDAGRRADASVEFARLDALFARLADQPDRDLATEALIEAGVVEAAAVDAANPDRDGFGPREAAWRKLGLEAGRLFRFTRRADPAGARRCATRARRLLAEAKVLTRDTTLNLRTPEGYAWHGLYPETYLEAAERFLQSSAPLPVVVIGLRGIGTSLSVVVAAALEAAGRRVETLTVRPRGEPPAREVRLDRRLEQRLARAAEAGAWFLIVDEGPGLSGSSFDATAGALNRLGAGDEQIVLFPGVVSDGRGLSSPSARERWSRRRKVQVSFESLRDTLAPGLQHARDLSGGLWREVLSPDLEHPAVAPQHERRKYLSPDGAVLYRYAGLGRPGRERLARAGTLAAAGLTPEPKSFADGFLGTEFVRGRSLHARRRDPEAIAHAAGYVAWLGRNARTGAALTGDELVPMILRNVGLSLGQAGLSRLGGLESWRRRLAGAPAVAIDGRLAPHEWVRSDAKTGSRLYKTDALDHHDDHFLPGDTDIAWDVAGFTAEWSLDDATASDFARTVADAASDPGLTLRLPFYETAYLAFRTGWTHLSASTMTAGPDRRGLERQKARYQALLDRSLERLAAAT